FVFQAEDGIRDSSVTGVQTCALPISVSPANLFWFNKSLEPNPYDPQSALRRLQQDGFRFDGHVLNDPDGHSVEFSVVTNAGNKYREQMAAMIQQDLEQIGVRLNIVTLDFPSLIER